MGGRRDRGQGRRRRKTGRRRRRPYRALDLVAAARTATREEAFAAEDEALADLLMSDELRAGLYAFDLVQKRAKRPAGAPDNALARPVTKVGIVGAGLMASQLALLFAQRLEVPVVLTDLDQERVDKGVGYVHAEIDKLAGQGPPRPRPVPTGSRRWSPARATRTASPTPTSSSRRSSRRWRSSSRCSPRSRRSSVRSACSRPTPPRCRSPRWRAGLAHPERVVGFHFFNPVAVMPLLEIVRGEHTDDATLATAFATGKALQKTCILVKDSPSFIVNRLLGRFMGEVARVVDEGTPIEVADRAFAGLAPMPPFVLLGLVGPAIALHNSETLVRAFPDRFYVSPTLQRVVEAGKRGFYDLGSRAGRSSTPRWPRSSSSPTSRSCSTRRRCASACCRCSPTRRAGCSTRASRQAPMDLDLAMITGAGLPVLERRHHAAARPDAGSPRRSPAAVPPVRRGERSSLIPDGAGPCRAPHHRRAESQVSHI